MSSDVVLRSLFAILEARLVLDARLEALRFERTDLREPPPEEARLLLRARFLDTWLPRERDRACLFFFRLRECLDDDEFSTGTLNECSSNDCDSSFRSSAFLTSSSSL